MPTAQQDLEYIRSAVEVLENYLLSQELYWPLSQSAVQYGSSNPTRLSLGGLLLANARARQRSADGPAGAQLDSLQAYIEALRQQWRTHWEKKAAQDLSARLNQWQNVLQDVLVEKNDTAKDFTREVRLRAMIELLRQEAGSELTALDDQRLSALDDRLRARWLDGDFVWEPELAAAFPQRIFWFLYGHPAGSTLPR